MIFVLCIASARWMVERIRGLRSPWWSDPITQMEDLWLEDER
jgi:hypothetical protein